MGMSNYVMDAQEEAEQAARDRAWSAAFRGEGGLLVGKQAHCDWVDESWPDYLTDAERELIEGPRGGPGEV